MCPIKPFQIGKNATMDTTSPGVIRPSVMKAVPANKRSSRLKVSRKERMLSAVTEHAVLPRSVCR